MNIEIIEQDWFSSGIDTIRHPICERNHPTIKNSYTSKFNRGLLLNVGIFKSLSTADKIITHDVDLLPSSRELQEEYLRPLKDGEAQHLAASWSRYGSNPNYVGGILAMSSRGWESLNGYPNNYFGWGGEDDDLRIRLNTENTIKEKIFDLIKTLDVPSDSVVDLENIATAEEKRETVRGIDTDNIIKRELLE